MVVLNMTMDAVPARRKELLQTLHELIGVMGNEQGFLEARVDIDAGDPNVMTLVQRWETQGAVDIYLRSEYFDVLIGAIEILATSSENTCPPWQKRIGTRSSKISRCRTRSSGRLFCTKAG